MFGKLFPFLNLRTETRSPSVDDGDNEPVVDNVPVIDSTTGRRGTRPTAWLLSLVPQQRSYGLQRWWAWPQQLDLPPDSMGPDSDDDEDLEAVVARVDEFRRRVWGL